MSQICTKSEFWHWDLVPTTYFLETKLILMEKIWIIRPNPLRSNIIPVLFNKVCIQVVGFLEFSDAFVAPKVQLKLEYREVGEYWGGNSINWGWGAHLLYCQKGWWHVRPLQDGCYRFEMPTCRVLQSYTVLFLPSMLEYWLNLPVKPWF